jgi:hypothetical protein
MILSDKATCFFGASSKAAAGEDKLNNPPMVRHKILLYQNTTSSNPKLDIWIGTSLKSHGKKGNQIVPIWIQGRGGLATLFPSP